MNNQILVTRSSMPSFEEYVAEIAELFESRWLTNAGVKYQLLEKELVKCLKVNHVSLFTNGHIALESALEAMELEGEVITTPFTFVSTVNAVVRKGLNPVFCDIEPDGLTLDPSLIEPLITEKTCAIVPVHVYGTLCDVDKIEQLAEAYGLKVIYDAAHAFGVEKDGRGVGDFGDASMFSFHATKVFNTIEGGAVTSSDFELIERLAKWKNFGLADSEDALYIGGNGKMNEFAAAMGLCNLRHIDEEIAKRKAVDARYREALAGMEGIGLRPLQGGVKSNYSYFPVLFDEAILKSSRDDIFKALADNGILARKYFYPLISDLSCYRGSYDSSATPVAQVAARSVLALPMFADLGLNDVDRICDIILDVIS